MVRQRIESYRTEICPHENAADITLQAQDPNRAYQHSLSEGDRHTQVWIILDEKLAMSPDSQNQLEVATVFKQV